jgi:hypothetical protein
MNLDRFLDNYSEQMGLDKRSLLLVLQGPRATIHSID